MTPEEKASAKDRVLSWVRSKNQQTMELKDGCIVRYVFPRAQLGVEGIFLGHPNYGNDDLWSIRVLNCVMPIPNKKHFASTAEILGSDMGLQELLIALYASGCPTKNDIGSDSSSKIIFRAFSKKDVISEYEIRWVYDLRQNLHNQSEDFYQALLPLIPNE